MTTLSQDKILSFETEDQYNDLPVAATTQIFEGCAVGDNASGYMRKLVAGDDFRGFCDRQADNSTGAAGDINVRVRREGCVRLPITSVAITDVDKPVYASDDNTFTLTATSNSYIGRILRVDAAAGTAIVAFEVDKGGLGEIAALTNSTTGTPNGTVNDVGAAFNQATLNKNFAELTVKVNALAQMLA